MRGIDTLTAVGLIAEIGDFAAFAHPRLLASFLGLVPSEKSTGDNAARPTAATYSTAVGGAYSVTATARKIPPTHLICHTRRDAWYQSYSDTAGQPVDHPVLSNRLSTVTSTQVSTTVGSTQDEVLLVTAPDLFLFTQRPRFIVADQTNITTGQVLFATVGYAASLPNRKPAGIALVTGTGLAAPAGF